MAIKTIPLSRLEADLRVTLKECADSGNPVLVELPDQRIVAIQALDVEAEDTLVDDLLESNPAFRALLAKSLDGHSKPFAPRPTRKKRRT